MPKKIDYSISRFTKKPKMTKEEFIEGYRSYVKAKKEVEKLSKLEINLEETI